MKKNLNKIIFWIGLCGVICAGLVFTGLQVYTSYSLYSDVLTFQNKSQKFEKQILTDLKNLEKFPAFKTSSYKSDASVYLQKYIPFVGHNLKTVKLKSNDNVEALFKKFPNWLRDKKDFNGLIGDQRFIDLDVKWLEKIMPFDYWTISNQNEIQQIIQNSNQMTGVQRIGALTSLPIPDYTLLKNWSIIYAIKKLQVKDFQAGLKVYRKAAELINSTGTLVAQMSAISMLKSEHKLMNDFQAQNWQLVPLSSIDAYKRVSWAWVHLAREPFFAEMNEKYKKFATPQYGVCAGAWENLVFLFGLRDYLEPEVIYEKSFAQNYKRAETFQENLLEQCHLNSFNHFIEYSSLANEKWITNDTLLSVAALPSAPHAVTSSLDSLNWSKVPYIRKILALKLLLIATPNSFKMYEDPNLELKN